MEKKNSVLLLALNGIMLVVIICLVILMVKPMSEKETRISGSLTTVVPGIDALNSQNQPVVRNKSGEQVVSLGGNRFAVIDNNPDSDTHGNVLVYEYDEKSGKLNFLTSDNFIMRMHQRTE
ncbi:hypothetical protein [Paenibacillus azoreducens]|uniref:Uncharacterized protein n=1 Tax=Paenibacillus azoreducens TaxID=116718 RepID=A0A919Y8N0_9BACL|nr:hypothetical protein [Paenibacillus azoreducens]GIO46652.1 hypothetical protein J34TS1_14170 [Paenibacillus azoreducens]